MKLWWPHNEMMIASLMFYRDTKDDYYLDCFYKTAEYCKEHFADPEYGEWFAYCDRRGELTHTLKGGKWKTFFHLPRCLMFSAGLMESLES